MKSILFNNPLKNEALRWPKSPSPSPFLWNLPHTIHSYGPSSAWCPNNCQKGKKRQGLKQKKRWLESLWATCLRKTASLLFNEWLGCLWVLSRASQQPYRQNPQRDLHSAQKTAVGIQDFAQDCHTPPQIPEKQEFQSLWRKWLQLWGKRINFIGFE